MLAFDPLHHPEDIDPAGRPLSRIERQSLLIREPDKALWEKQRQWLYEDFAELNGLNLTRHIHPPRLVNPKAGRRWQWDPLPCAGHVRYFNWQGYPAAIVSETEHPAEVAALLAYAEKYGLTVQQPPNPRACFGNPGIGRFLVLTGKLWTGPVKWLPEQANFGLPAGSSAPPKS